MTGAEHFAAAERIAAGFDEMAEMLKNSSGDKDLPHALQLLDATVALAGVHATLALAAAVEKAGDCAHGYGTPGYGR